MCFPTMGEAKKAKNSKHMTYLDNNGKPRRMKHRSGSKKEVRAYFCDVCQAYHLTSLPYFKKEWVEPKL